MICEVVMGPVKVRGNPSGSKEVFTAGRLHGEGLEKRDPRKPRRPTRVLVADPRRGTAVLSTAAAGRGVHLPGCPPPWAWCRRVLGRPGSLRVASH